MSRAILLVLDSLGCGAAVDAAAYGDEGADTIAHIAEACARGEGNRAGSRAGPLVLPNLCALGLGSASGARRGPVPPGLTPAPSGASWGFATEISAGKDTPSGHWELAGTPVLSAWGSFPRTEPCFPPDLIDALVRETALPGVLGNRHASGTAIIAELGLEHLRTGKPICYTSVDSVFQVAAHEAAFGLDRLYALCRAARRLCDPLNIGRVIARPFVGATPEDFRRTGNRKDYAVPPPAGNLLQRAADGGRPVITVGKIGDIFCHRHTGEERKGDGNDANLDHVLAAVESLPAGGLVFANLVDFDSEFGHRRDVAGYADCLERFDRRLPDLIGRLRPEDILVLTADHGNDPTFPGTDHTRETVPILAHAPARGAMPIGARQSFADVGASLAAFLGLEPTPAGRSWI